MVASGKKYARGVALRQDEGFVLHHYAGAVEYNVHGFLRKSAERLPLEIETLLLETPTSVARLVLVDHLPLPTIDDELGAIPSASPNLVAAAMRPLGSPNGKPLGPRQGKPKPLQRLGGGGTVGRQFVGVVRALMAELSDKAAFFVRCISPNTTAAPADFQGAHVLQQLRVSGTSAMLRMMHTAHPTRIPYNELYSRHRASAPPELAALQPNDFVEGLVLALGIPERNFELGHTMIFFKHGAAAQLHALEGLTPDELRVKLHAAVKDFAAHSVARRVIERGVIHWMRWRRLRRAREQRKHERNARDVITQAVGAIRLRDVARASVAARKQALALERAAALHAANAAVARLKQVWQNPPALEAALKAAEAAARHKSLPVQWAKDEHFDLAAAHLQLQKLKGWEAQEKAIMDAQNLVAGGATKVSSAVALLESSQAKSPELSVPNGGAAKCDDKRWLHDDGLLQALQLQPRADVGDYAQRLRNARPPCVAPSLQDTPAFASMVCGHGREWPAARKLRRFTLCFSPMSEGLEIEQRLLNRDLVPYLEQLCRRLGVEMSFVEPIPLANEATQNEHAKVLHASQVLALLSSARQDVLAKDLLAECCEQSIGVWYVGLVGDQLPPARPPLIMARRHHTALQKELASKARLLISKDGVDKMEEKRRADEAKAMREASSWLLSAYRGDDNAAADQLALHLSSAAVSSHVYEASRASIRLQEQGVFDAKAALEVSGHFLAREIVLAGSASRHGQLKGRASNTSAAKGLPSPRVSRHPAVLVARQFVDRPPEPSAGAAIDDSEFLNGLLRAMPTDALLQFTTPWQAGGLQPSELAAHRIYLRELADKVAMTVADALIKDSSDPIPMPSSLEDELALHLGAMERHAAHASSQVASNPTLRQLVTFLLLPVCVAENQASIAEAQASQVPLIGIAARAQGNASFLPGVHGTDQARTNLRWAEARPEKYSASVSPHAATCSPFGCFSLLWKARQTKKRVVKEEAPDGWTADAVSSSVVRMDQQSSQSQPNARRESAEMEGVLMTKAEPSMLELLAEVRAASESATCQQLLVLSGETGGGKTTQLAASVAAVARLLAKPVKQTNTTKRHLERSNGRASRGVGDGPVVCIRFMGLSTASSHVGSLLLSICQQLAVAYGQAAPLISEVDSLPSIWHRWLRYATASRPLILALDGIDFLSSNSGGDLNETLLRWLPIPTPPAHVFLLLSCSASLLPQLRWQLGAAAAEMICNLPQLTSEDQKRLIETALASSGRKLQPAQLDALLTAASVAKDGLTGEDLSPAVDSDALSRYRSQVVVLFTPMTNDHVATVATRKLLTQLKGLAAPLVQLDGTAHENHSVRAVLWTRADAKPGTYPILYIGRTGRTYKGEEIQDLIESGDLPASISPSHGRGSALHLRLLAALAVEWSDETMAPSTLPENARAAAIRLFDDAERRHGELLVRSTCGLLSAARDGLSVGELQRVLSSDNKLLTALLSGVQRPPHSARVPPARLHLLLCTELEPLIHETLAAAHGGAPLLRWRHDLFAGIAAERYAGSTDALKHWHRVLADFWTGSTPSPLPPLRLRDGGTVRIPDDRGLLGQPLQLPCGEDGRTSWYNRRAMRELPTHLAGCGAYDELAETLISLTWLSATLAALGVADLLESFTVAIAAESKWNTHPSVDSESTGSEALSELRAMKIVLSLCADAIKADPDQLELQLLARLPHHIQAAAVRGGAQNLESLQLQLELSLARRAAMKKVVFRPVWPSLPGTRTEALMLNTTGAGSFSAPTASCFDAPDRGATSIICGYESGIVRLYDSQTGDEHDIQLADGFAVISVVLSVADHRAVTCNSSGLLRVMSIEPRRAGPEQPLATRQANVPAGEELKHFPLLVPRPGIFLSCGDEPSAIQVWSLQGTLQDPIHTLRVHSAPVQALAASEDGMIVASGDNGGGCVVWSAQTEDGYVRLQVIPTAHTAAIAAVAVTHSPRGRVGEFGVTTTERTCQIAEEVAPTRIWSLETVMDDNDGMTALDTFCKAELSEESLSFLIEVRLWKREWNNRSDAVRDATAQAIVRKYLQPGAPMEVSLPNSYAMDTPLAETMFDVALAHARSTLVLDILPRFEETEAGAELRERLTRPSDDRACATPCALASVAQTSPAKESGVYLVATGCDDGTIAVWAAHSGRKIQSLLGHAGAVSSVEALGTANLLLSISTSDATLRVWDLLLGEQLRVLAWPSASRPSIAQFAFDSVGTTGSDGKMPAEDQRSGETLTCSGSAPEHALAFVNGCIQKLDLNHPDWIEQAYRRHDMSVSRSQKVFQSVSAVALDRDGHTALSAADGVICQWKLGDRGWASAVSVAHGHEGELSSMRMDAEGSIALVGGHDGWVSVWMLEDGLQKQPMLSVPANTFSNESNDASVLALELSESGMALALRADRSAIAWAWAGGPSSAHLLSTLTFDDARSDASSFPGYIAATIINGSGIALPTVALVVRSGACRVEVLALNKITADGSSQGAAAASHFWPYSGHEAPISAVSACNGVDDLAPVAASVSGSDVHVWGVLDGRALWRLSSQDGPCLRCVALRCRYLMTGATNGVLGLYAASAPSVRTDQGHAEGTDQQGHAPASPPTSRRDEAERAAASLQQQLEELNRGARATEAERELQAKKTPSIPQQQANGLLRDEAAPASSMPLEMLTWGMDTPVASARESARRTGGPTDASELSDEDEPELMVITPPLGSPLASMRSQDDDNSPERDDDLLARRELVQIL